jgi:H+/Cl- antiporter ClcA
MAEDGRSPKSALFQRPFGVWPQRLVVAATAAYAAVLVFATHYPNPQELMGGRLPSDKLLHFLAYGVLGFLAALVLRSRGRRAAAWPRRSHTTRRARLPRAA